ncbi:hypothetical protein TNCV_1120401 [Trichonephila clavipes]|uniref:Uncharacterized protein n=1 Tax=Trichonephila clavipes TaxID=2585209 RepID=A0A8X6SZ28_TRICX|nr:hypothetical protein TNCV_1120401 [Trichonephila clavipes]
MEGLLVTSRLDRKDIGLELASIITRLLRRILGTVIQDDYDTNVDSEKELSLPRKLELAIATKILTKQNIVEKSDISKTIRREFDLFEDDRFRCKYL